MERNTHDNYILRARKLFQQFLVDMWEIAEAQKLKWNKNNQKTLRAEKYHVVQQALLSNEAGSSGEINYPASFKDRERWYDKYYQNAMALVRHYDKPTFFITMTLNDNCPEVQQHLLPGMTPYNRADMLCRIFELKKASHCDDCQRSDFWKTSSLHCSHRVSKEGYTTYPYTGVDCRFSFYSTKY